MSAEGPLLEKREKWRTRTIAEMTAGYKVAHPPSGESAGEGLVWLSLRHTSTIAALPRIRK